MRCTEQVLWDPQSREDTLELPLLFGVRPFVEIVRPDHRALGTQVILPRVAVECVRVQWHLFLADAGHLV